MTETQNKTVQTTQEHNWPHVPKLQWEQVYGPISNTTITTFLFLVIVLVFSIFAKLAIKKENSKLKTAVLNIVGFLDKYLLDSFNWDKKFSRAFFPLIAWFFIMILFWNLLWLIIDWFGGSVSPTILHYFRPIYSDLNTTLVLWIITVVTFIWISIKYSGTLKTTKWYLFNFHGASITEKCINVFVGWLHLIWIPSTIASLSLRLFGNIFAWIVLIWVITYLWATMTESFHLLETWRLLSIPFWFFEVFVAFIQSAVFAGLMIAYFNQNKESSH